MSDQELIIADLKKQVRSLLIPAKDGLTPQQLERDYMEIVGSRLPPRGLGYRSTMDMVLDMPDVVKICPTGDGSVILKGIPNDSTMKIASLVARQKTSSKTRSAHYRSQSARFTSYSRLPRRSRTAPILPAIVKSELKDLLSFSPVLVSKFEQAYRQRFGRDFQYLCYGFYSMFEVLQAASDIVSVQQTRAGSLLVLKNNPRAMESSGKMTKPVQYWQPFSLLPVKQTAVQNVPVKPGTARNLQKSNVPSGTQGRLMSQYVQENTLSIGTYENEETRVRSSSDTQKPLMTPKSQKTVLPTDTQKEIVTLYPQDKGSPGSPFMQEMTSPSGARKHEIVCVQIQTSLDAKKTVVISNPQSVLLPQDVQTQVMTVSSQEQRTPPTSQEGSVSYIQGQMSPIENRKSVCVPSLQGQTVAQEIKKQELAQYEQAGVFTDGIDQERFTTLQQVEVSLPVTTKYEVAHHPSGGRPTSDIQVKETVTLETSAGTLKLEDVTYLHGHSSPQRILNQESSPNCNEQMSPASIEMGMFDALATGTTEYFVWKLQQLEEEAKVSLAQKGPGGTIDSELKEKIRFVAAQHDDGLLVNKLPLEFQAIFEEEIPLKQLGFVNLLELVLSLGDILYLESKDGDQDLRIFDAKKWKKINDQKLIMNDVQKKDRQLEILPPDIDFSCWDSPLQEYENAVPKSLGIITHDSKLWKIQEKLLIPDPTILDVPPDAVRNQSLHSLPTLQMGTLLAAYVESIISPNEFYVRCYSEDTSEVLENMMIEMRRCYSTENVSERYLIPPDWIRPGFVCCVRVHGDVWWYRVIVYRVTSKEKVEVFYPDFGHLATVNRVWLRLLKCCYLKLAAQAIPSALAWVKPLEAFWTAAAIKRFKYLCDPRPLVAIVHEYLDGVLHVFLCDTTSDEDLYLHNVLREEGHAIVLRENLPSKGFRALNPAKLYLTPASKQSADEAIVSNSSQALQSQVTDPTQHLQESQKQPQGSPRYCHASSSGHPSRPHQEEKNITNQTHGSQDQAGLPTKHPQDSDLQQGSHVKHIHGSQQQASSSATHLPDLHLQNVSSAQQPHDSQLQACFPERHSQGSQWHDCSPARHLQETYQQDICPSSPPDVSHHHDNSPSEHSQYLHFQDSAPVRHPQSSHFDTPAKESQVSKHQNNHTIEEASMSLDSTGRKCYIQAEEDHELELPYLEPVPASIDIWDENWPLSIDSKISKSDNKFSNTSKPGHLSTTYAAAKHEQNKTLPQEESDFFGESLESVTLPKSLEEFYISLIKSKTPDECTSLDPDPAPSAFKQPEATETAEVKETSEGPTHRTETPAPENAEPAETTEAPASLTEVPSTIKTLAIFSSHEKDHYQDGDAKHISPILSAGSAVSHRIHVPRITTTALGAAARMATSGAMLHWFPGVGGIVKDLYQSRRSEE
ncbi:tudor domain-containing protein 5 isoform X2 [Pleurodeles waltl]|uniref:tudor domain-containing protein 5 isoform X2 n=1 Tax=Pleurodeles waltl TaxID=8319 RepID=UPI003709698B